MRRHQLFQIGAGLQVEPKLPGEISGIRIAIVGFMASYFRQALHYNMLFGEGNFMLVF